jgi:erythromycin esterase-like protein
VREHRSVPDELEIDVLSVERRALRAIVAVRRVLDELEAELVRTARLEGASWTHLGRDLGLTRQGARRRHLEIDPLPRRPSRPVSGLDAYFAQKEAARERMPG